MYFIKCMILYKCYDPDMFTLIHHGGLKMFRLFKRPEVNLFAGQTLSIESNGLDLDNIICVFIQIPKYTSMTGRVHLTNETLHQPVLTLEHTQTHTHTHTDTHTQTHTHTHTHTHLSLST